MRHGIAICSASESIDDSNDCPHNHEHNMNAATDGTLNNRHHTGFTIVELLIVIVVIAILAAIIIVTYNNVQARARDSQRLSDTQTMIKALEAYKAVNWSYPSGSPSTGAAVCSPGRGSGYQYSDATDGTWLPSLVGVNGIVNQVPTAPNNGCASYYSYLHPNASSYGCSGLRTTGYYILQVVGVEAMSPPSYAVPNGTTWRPCTGATAGWSTGATHWTFEKDDS